MQHVRVARNAVIRSTPERARERESERAREREKERETARARERARERERERKRERKRNRQKATGFGVRSEFEVALGILVPHIQKSVVRKHANLAVQRIVHLPLKNPLLLNLSWWAALLEGCATSQKD